MKIIGNKAKFAIECKVNRVSPYIMGHIRLWLNNSYIGFFEEEVMLMTSLCSLEYLLSEEKVARLQKISIPGDMSSEKLMKFLEHDDGVIHDYTMFNVDESTDDFSIHVFKDKQNMKFLWRLHRSPRGKYRNYPKVTRSASVAFVDLLSTISEFKEWLFTQRQLKQ